MKVAPPLLSSAAMPADDTAIERAPPVYGCRESEVGFGVVERSSDLVRGLLDTGACTCTNTCKYHNDGGCDDGGPGKDYSVCDRGTDCADCGPSTRTSLAVGASCTGMSNDRSSHAHSAPGMGHPPPRDGEGGGGGGS